MIMIMMMILMMMLMMMMYRDGANIVVAAKTAEPHPKLPGTIYTGER